MLELGGSVDGLNMMGHQHKQTLMFLVSLRGGKEGKSCVVSLLLYERCSSELRVQLFGSAGGVGGVGGEDRLMYATLGNAPDRLLTS